jgi:hypothetical protein
MKRTIFGLVATAIAICSFAFTMPVKSKHLTTKLFNYTGPDYKQSHVQTDVYYVTAGADMTSITNRN